MRSLTAACFVFTIIAAAVAASAQDRKATDAQADGLVGRVHSVAGERVLARSSKDGIKEEGRRRPIEGVSYDSAGRVESRALVDDYGGAAGQQVYRYEGGRLLEATVHSSKGALLERRLPHYGADNLAETMTLSDEDGEGYVERYVRGAGGRLDATIYLVHGEEMGRSLFSYAAGPEPSEVAFVTADGEPATAPLGPCLGGQRVTMSYEAGRIAQQSIYRADGSLKQRSSFRYDDVGNVVSELRTTSIGTDRLTHKYEFDTAGNWTKRVSSIEYDIKPNEPARADMLLNITSRTITYY